MTKPWHGILTATATPFRSDLSLDFEKYAEHIQWLAANDTHGA
ncbi:MAG: dihydrodipicolinate synthase family protein, partial [Actinobacteria bacterium]|nr:dihydrodipicolinate synthase family protein [Actinomycetota bacterium]MSW57870.1 dihydrodipicolinate synthase family protein [Actinomycetota bacterium]MSY10132.1 dihydrodipicolinate synthase family protein [Actinomycetota bacterium]